MSKYLDKAKELRAIVTPHYNCCQSVLLPFAEDAGLTKEQAMAIGDNFGGGMRRAAACGAVCGGLMALGLYGIGDPSDALAFQNKIKENHEGCIDCADLLRINKEKGCEKKPHCDAMVFECVTLVEEMLRAAGKI